MQALLIAAPKRHDNFSSLALLNQSTMDIGQWIIER
jgi:hypothetical protein